MVKDSSHQRPQVTNTYFHQRPQVTNTSFHQRPQVSNVSNLRSLVKSQVTNTEDFTLIKLNDRKVCVCWYNDGTNKLRLGLGTIFLCER